MTRRFFFGNSHNLLILCLLLIGCSSINFSQSGENKARNINARTSPDPVIIPLLREAARPLTGSERDYDPLMELIGDARFVMLGEATHGTHEFYRERARISRRLIEEKGFDAVVLEADWTNASRVNRYLQGEGGDTTAEKALSGFKQFPRWMWRNTDFRDFVSALKTYNAAQTDDKKRVSVYGMDVYGLFESADAVINYLKKVDPDAARRARRHYNCFSYYRQDPQLYGMDVFDKTARSCQRDVEQQFIELQQLSNKRRAEKKADDELFDAHQNARVVKNAEAYYRTIYRRGISSWNLRDLHMADTLEALARHIESKKGKPAKLVVWAHNTHQGDARMTERALVGEHNVGQLMRQRYGKDTVLVGFTTYTGYVRAASEWGGADLRKRVRPALEGSYSALFHKTGVPNFLLLMRGGGRVAEELSTDRLERAIGVIYLPQTERVSHYFHARLSRQFDAVIHFDVTNDVKPLY